MKNQKLLADIAQDYYIEQLSLNQLSRKYHLSRYLLNKHLEDARAQGVVKISVSTPIRRNQHLEARLKEFFDCSIYVIDEEEKRTEDMLHLIQFAASHIQEAIQTSHVIGTASGNTLHDVIDYFKPQPLEHLLFTQYMGQDKRYGSSVGSRHLVEKAAKKFAANYETLSGPLYIADETTRRGMLREFASQPALQAASQMDLLFCALGTLKSVNANPLWREHLLTIFPKLRQDDVAGLVFGRPYNVKGKFLTVGNDHVFGLPLEQILATPRRIGIVKNKFKKEATLGALRANIFTDLIISETLARFILEEL